MQLMISVVSAEEAQEAIAGGAEILDVKNPAEGSLGAQFPRVIRQIHGVIQRSANVPIKLSVAIGDMPNLPGTAALAALGAAHCGAQYVKVGLHDSYSEAEAVVLLREVQQAVRGFPVVVIGGGYADFRRVNALDPRLLPRLVVAAGAGGCLVDTAIKDGSSLFDFMAPKELQALAEEAHVSGLLFGLAGALREQDLPLVRQLEADVVGLRTAACRDNCRTGRLEAERVQRLHAAIMQPLPAVERPVGRFHPV